MRRNATARADGRAARGRGGVNRLRAALVLHGKIGSIDRGQGWPRAVDGAPPNLDLPLVCYAAMVRHLISANADRYDVDVFGHSWNPELGAALDAIYEPQLSGHEHEQLGRNRRLCLMIGMKLRVMTTTLGLAPFSRFGGVGRGADSCERTASHMLGMQRAIMLKARAERAGGYRYDVVVVSRWDVLWNRPLSFARLDLSGGAFSVPTFCSSQHSAIDKALESGKLNEYRRNVCGGAAHTQTQVPTAATGCVRTHRPCMADLSPRARELYLLDWWFASSSRAADDFARVGGEEMFANYTVLNSQRLNGESNPRPVVMGHAFWGMHMVWGLRAPLRFVATIEVDFSLGRAWERNGGCRGVRHLCAGPTCTVDDAISRPWQQGLPTELPAQTAPSYRYGAEQTRGACSHGTFFCARTSRLCREEALTHEPMDSYVGRLRWMKCTAGVCERLGEGRYTARCAGVLLAHWVRVWRSLPGPNETLARELSEAGAFSGGAIERRERRHASQALVALTSRAEALLAAPRVGGRPSPQLSVAAASACAADTLGKPLSALRNRTILPARNRTGRL